MARNILVPVDGSGFGELALPVAEKIARAADATLHVVRIHVPATQAPVSLEGMPVVDAGQDATRWGSERAYVKRIADRLTAAGARRVRSGVLDGPVAEGLATYALLNDVDLIVMSTHGRDGLARAWMGSVADEVMRNSSAPLLLVRPEGDAAEPLVPRDTPRILIALDGSGLAEEVVEPAVELGQKMGAEYLLVRAVGQPAPEAVSYLTRIAWWLRDRGLRVETRMLVSERPDEAILKVAREERASVVAMATHGRSGLLRLVMGSVTARVLSGVQVPLLLCRPASEPYRRRTRPVPVAAAAV